MKVDVVEKAEMQTSEQGLELIKRHEGLSLKEYICPGNVRTIGYGHAIKPGEMFGGKITEEKAEELLKADVKHAEDVVNGLVKIPLTQEQFDALVSFVFNLGGGAFLRSTMLRLINEGKTGKAAKEFDRWVHAAGKRLPGLVKRRKDERNLFEGKK